MLVVPPPTEIFEVMFVVRAGVPRMRLLICGSRYWSDRDTIRQELLRIRPSVVIEGGASGADTIAREEATKLGIEVIEFRAIWEWYGSFAGPIRNKRMLTEGKPDMVLAFHQDIAKSTGTVDMIAQAKKAGITVELIST